MKKRYNKVEEKETTKIKAFSMTASILGLSAGAIFLISSFASNSEVQLSPGMSNIWPAIIFIAIGILGTIFWKYQR